MDKVGNEKKHQNTNLDKKKYIIAIVLFFLILIIIIFSYYSFFNQKQILEEKTEIEILDDTISPAGVNQAVSLEIKRIHKKGIEDLMRKIGNSWKKKPNYHFVAIIDDVERIGSEINSWDTGYVGWENVKIVEDEQAECIIELKIIETKKRLLRSFDQEVVNYRITYDFRTGRWHGDDNFNDSDGYGHLSSENYEIWFDVHQTELDNDGIPYWWEVNKLHTDPNLDDSKLDPDMDGIPTSWEWRWNYNPFIYDNHSIIDPEKDGLSNLEEYTMRTWLADPYYQDIYIEVDFMEKGPGFLTRDHVFWKESQYMLMDEFHKHDITVHIDDGWLGGTNNGGEYLNFIKEYINMFGGMGTQYYKYHFADERKGIFRYIFMCHSGGWAWPQDHKMWVDVMSIPTSFNFYATTYFPPALTPRQQRLAMAVGVMHELGHSLGLITMTHGGIDNGTMVGRNDLPPLQKMKARSDAIEYWSNYESCMNYNKFAHFFMGYSDGSNGKNDFDDWSSIDLTFFNKPFPYNLEL